MLVTEGHHEGDKVGEENWLSSSYTITSYITIVLPLGLLHSLEHPCS